VAAGRTDAPQDVQKAETPSTGSAQAGQRAGRGPPQLPQNRAPGGVDEAHAGQLDPMWVIVSGNGVG
jgi:hypothetical protein